MCALKPFKPYSTCFDNVILRTAQKRWHAGSVSTERVEVELGLVLESELGQKLEIRCVKGMYRLKLVSSERFSGFKG